MARFTVRVDDNSEIAEWLEAEADERDRSKAWVVREALALAAGADSVYSSAPRTAAGRIDSSSTDSRRLRERVIALEAAVFNQPPSETVEEPGSGGANPTPDTPETPIHESETPEMDVFREELGEWLLDHGPRTEHGRRGVLVVVDELEARGPLTSEDLTDSLSDEIGDQYSRRKSMWESIKRHLVECPGIEQTENYQEWDFIGVANALDELRVDE